MINKITKEQEGKIPEFINKYINLASEQIDEDKARQAIFDVYEEMGEKKPEIIICDSPTEAMMSAKKYFKEDDLKSIKDNYYLSYWWLCWVGYYEYAKYIGVKFDERKFNLFKNFVIQCPFILPYEEIAFISKNPDIKWEEGKLHSEAGKSVEYPDGWGMYNLKGIQFEEELYWKIVNKTITPSEAIRLENAEQRIIAISYIGGDRLMTECDGVSIDKETDNQYGELIELKKLKDTQNRNYKYLKALDPSKNEYVYLRVHPDTKTVREAQANSYKLEIHGLKYNPELRT